MSKAKMTAEFASAVRALGQREDDLVCPDYFAPSMISGKLRFLTSSLIRNLTIKILHKKFPNLYAFHMVRTLYIDAVVKRLIKGEAIEQVVLLGAGLDTRGARFSELGVSFFELDFPFTQEMKKERIARVKKQKEYNDSNVTYIPIDFNSDKPFPQLKDNGFDSKKKTLVIWEGVTMYLPETVIKSVLSEIAENCESGSYVVFDYLVPKNIEPNNQQGKDFVRKLNEEYIFGIVPDLLDVFIASCGLQVEENYTYKELNEKFLSETKSPYLNNALTADSSPALALLKTV